jgi:hypothetical protein
MCQDFETFTHENVFMSTKIREVFLRFLVPLLQPDNEEGMRSRCFNFAKSLE